LKIMREIGAFEAKNELGELLDLVEAGQEIVITRRGKPRLVACGPRAEPERARKAAATKGHPFACFEPGPNTGRRWAACSVMPAPADIQSGGPRKRSRDAVSTETLISPRSLAGVGKNPTLPCRAL
jgi:prevent-host-death family protein